jgi:hypothetical protein
MSSTHRVYGDRICTQCAGICHEGSWRAKYGQRKHYFCCESHLRAYKTGCLQASCCNAGLRNWQDVRYSASDWEQTRNEFYERVDVITR